MAKNQTQLSKLTAIRATLAGSLLVGVMLLIGGLLLDQRPVRADDVVVYKSPTCGCCKEWVSHLRKNGYKVTVHDRRNMDPIKRKMSVPQRLQSCHTAQVGEYVIEGHVPAADIARLLREKPPVMGLTAPGMPMGSPGMEGPRKDPYEVLTFQSDGKTSVYSRHNQ
ncbi:MAG: DUF411 domain-containing protein [Candidatus Thiodiazotropha taylori]|nr:DUF411 domain-containing protein [Candidatus Thiodiazotropha endolucinida]MCG8079825.1 DUF411 domain-containing protein [Candidatus Thiodiazotropha taylori]MCG8088292.1 DUF411 domain-containing protein [Candidatus Thiodiazotropha taylori]MCW4228362.1 DUF411 domain-containing protein [Candidatus Thiodiazotropha taylori]MCW4273662.1 DUF411 domain-containing protein [Candidatus Thiodiazotropha taylori]